MPKYLSRSGRTHLYEVRSLETGKPVVRRVLSIGRHNILSWINSKGRITAVVRGRDGEAHTCSGNATTTQSADGIIITDQIEYAQGSPMPPGVLEIVMDVRRQAFEPLARRGLLHPQQQQIMSHLYGVTPPSQEALRAPPLLT